MNPRPPAPAHCVELVSVARFELATPSTPRTCATRLRYTEMPGFYLCKWSRTARSEGGVDKAALRKEIKDVLDSLG